MEKNNLRLMTGCVLVALAVSGCANMNNVERGTAQGAGIGAGVGALIGAIAGGDGGSVAAGAAIGGALGAVAGNAWTQRLENQKRAMEEATKGTGVEVSRTADNRLKIAIPTDISFDVNKADIRPNLRPILDKFVTTLQDNPSTRVTIVGHTDNTGTDTINDPLSLQRAARTRDYLTVRGINASRFQVEGLGSHQPLVENNSAANRAKNRRVEIYVYEPQA